MNRYDMESMRMRDGRNPYGSRGGYVVSRRSRRGRRDRAMRDRGMDYAYDRGDYRGGDYEYSSGRGDRAYSGQDYERNRRDYESGRQFDMAGNDYGDMRRGRDGHYGTEGRTYYPIEAMGTFNGYYGMGEQDYGRGGRGRDYGVYADYGDYGEKLTKEELDEWKHKLMKEVEEKDKQFFTKEYISQKARQSGAEMKDYNEDELLVATAMIYTDYCKTIRKFAGNNMDIYIELAKDWLEDKDTELKGGEKLAVYYDCIVEGED